MPATLQNPTFTGTIKPLNRHGEDGEYLAESRNDFKVSQVAPGRHELSQWCSLMRSYAFVSNWETEERAKEEAFKLHRAEVMEWMEVAS